jgi:hypothetical protein
MTAEFGGVHIAGRRLLGQRNDVVDAARGDLVGQRAHLVGRKFEVYEIQSFT